MHMNKKLQSASKGMSKFKLPNAALVANDHIKSISDPKRRQILTNLRDMVTCSKQGQRYEVLGAGDDFIAIPPQSYNAYEPEHVPDPFLGRETGGW